MIEVMIAILVTAIALIGIMAMYITGSRASAYSRHTTEASVLAEDGIEKLRSEGTPVAATLSGVNEQGVVVAGGLFTRTSTVVGPIGTAPSAYYDLTVTVTWTEDGRARTVKLNARRNQ
jgi:Tfp pilus assembly protein PilV